MFERLLFSTILLVASFAIYAQDSLDVAALQDHTVYFTLKNKEIHGPGADFLRQAFVDHQYVLLGEYHDSPRISELTTALLPLYYQAGGRHLALEVGPTSATILLDFAATPERTMERIRDYNRKYILHGAKRDYYPIPFFSNRKDAVFLAEAGKLNLQMIGLDQEFIFGYLALVDHAFTKLPEKRQRGLRTDYRRVRDTLSLYYEKEVDYIDKRTEEGKRFIKLLHHSAFVNGFLDNMASVSPEVKDIISLIRQSAEIYRQSGLRHYWRSNELRTESFVTNLRNGLQATDFKLQSDKLLVKMGGLHTAKGKNNYSMFDVGNTLAELARFHGNSSLHTDVLSRYHQGADGEITDELADKESWFAKSFGDFIQMGRKEEWAVIDLRGLRDSFYYQQKFEVNDRIREYFDRYDVVLITPMDVEGIKNN
ncbi:hypothetical protein [Neolewinella persica]|uniref:hypothetical protein n=1 Tax=Neolewinella persica TaxID=70998 RepID=UPI000377E169|nr:hypothetical protein [Neolewinella persica]